MLDKDKYKLNRGYNVSVSGCNKRCPCRQWVNCAYYVDVTDQQRRLKNKSTDTIKSIHKWYEVNFRIKYEHADSVGNG